MNVIELARIYNQGVEEGKRQAAQKPWVGLTEEERQEIWKGCDPQHAGYVTALVEAKLKEKNT
jgi:D-serine dehydratase